MSYTTLELLNSDITRTFSLGDHIIEVDGGVSEADVLTIINEWYSILPNNTVVPIDAYETLVSTDWVDYGLRNGDLAIVFEDSSHGNLTTLYVFDGTTFNYFQTWAGGGGGGGGGTINMVPLVVDEAWMTTADWVYDSEVDIDLTAAPVGAEQVGGYIIVVIDTDTYRVESYEITSTTAATYDQSFLTSRAHTEAEVESFQLQYDRLIYAAYDWVNADDMVDNVRIGTLYWAGYESGSSGYVRLNAMGREDIESIAPPAVADQRIMGNVSGGSASPIALTLAQIRTFLGSSGTPSGTTYLRGDGTWSTPSGGMADPGGANDDFMQRKGGAWTYRTPAQAADDLPVLQVTGGGKDTVHNLGNLSGGITIDLANGNSFYGTLTGNVTSVTLSGATSGKECQFILETTQDTTPRTITWGSAWKWPGGFAFSASEGSGAKDLWVARTRDGGTTIHIVPMGGAFA